MSVNRGKLGPQYPGDRTCGKFKAFPAGKGGTGRRNGEFGLRAIGAYAPEGIRKK